MKLNRCTNPAEIITFLNRFKHYLNNMPLKNGRSTNGKEFLSCRDVLWYLTFCGFAISAMHHVNLSLTIIAMVIPRSKVVIVSQCKPDVQTTFNLSDIWANGSSVTIFKEHNVTQIPVLSLKLTTNPENATPVSPVNYPDRFAWNEYEQGLVLAGAFWIHWTTQIPGGLLARRYGTKFTFGWSNFANVILSLLIPFCARYHLYALVALRMFQGLLTGLIWPSMHDLVAKWIPPDERSKFISSYIGSSVGAAITLPLCAMLINWFGWDSVFYLISVLGFIWNIAWYYLVYDSPEKHPRISAAEKTYILESLGDSVNHVTSRPVPWKAILTSGPIWITSITSSGGTWAMYTMSIDGPSYFNHIHGWDINTTGWLSATHHLMRMLFSYVFSSFGDWLLKTKKMSTTNLRKFAMLVCNGIQCFMLLGLTFSGCYSNLAIILIIVGSAASGSIAAGTLASFIDLSPNYAGINMAICNIVTTIGGFISPLMVGILTNNNQTIEQWRLVFLINLAIVFTTGALYMFLGTSELQPWNDLKHEETNEELQKLRSNVGGIDNVKTINVITFPQTGKRLSRL